MILFNNSLLQKLLTLVGEPTEQATPEKRKLYAEFKSLVENCFYISHDTSNRRKLTILPAKSNSIESLQKSLRQLLGIADLAVINLGGNNAPIFLIRHGTERIVFKIVPLSPQNITAYELCDAHQSINGNLLLIPKTFFRKIQLRPQDNAKYNMTSTLAYYVCLTAFVPQILISSGTLISSNLKVFFDAKEKPATSKFHNRYREAIHYCKKMAEVLLRMWNLSDDPKKKVIFIDIKALNFHIIKNRVMPIDLKSGYDGESIELHQHNGEWCFKTTGNILYDTTRKYIPDYPGLGEYAEHCPVFKYICTAICLNLFELATGENLKTGFFGDSVEPMKQAWNTFSISKTLLGDLILKSLHNEIDDLKAFIVLLKDANYLLEEGTISAGRLPEIQNPINLSHHNDDRNSDPKLILTLPHTTQDTSTSNSDTESLSRSQPAKKLSSQQQLSQSNPGTTKAALFSQTQKSETDECKTSAETLPLVDAADSSSAKTPSNSKLWTLREMRNNRDLRQVSSGYKKTNTF